MPQISKEAVNHIKNFLADDSSCKHQMSFGNDFVRVQPHGVQGKGEQIRNVNINKR